MISWPVAFVFAASSLAIAISAGTVALVEPGAARVSAGAIAVLLFVFVVFGLAGMQTESKALLVRRLLVRASIGEIGPRVLHHESGRAQLYLLRTRADGFLRDSLPRRQEDLTNGRTWSAHRDVRCG